MGLTKPAYNVNNVQSLADLVQDQSLTVKQTLDKGTLDGFNYQTSLCGEIDTALALRDTNLNTHKSSADHDGRYYTETELNAGQLNNIYYTETESNTIFATKTDIQDLTIGTFGTNFATEAMMAPEMKKQAGGVAPFNSLSTHEGLTSATGAHGLDSSMAKFKNGSSTYTDNDTSQTFTDAFCTVNSMVVVSITSSTIPQGTWSVESGAGSFTITSTVAESADITFDYFITKVV